MDTLVGRLLDRLQATGLYDPAVLVVTADHGASFLPGEPYRLATSATVADIARTVGYADPFGFSAAFKRVRGANPSEFRRTATGSHA